MDSRAKFDATDPLRDLHVSRRKRLNTDEGEGSNALDGGDDREDLARYRPGGDLYSDDVVGPEKLT